MNNQIRVGYQIAVALLVPLCVSLSWNLYLCAEQIKVERSQRQAEAERYSAALSKTLKPDLSLVCPAWFFETNLKVAKQKICEGK